MFSPNCVIVLVAPDIAIKSSVVRGKLTGKFRENLFSYLHNYNVNFTKVNVNSGRFFVNTNDTQSVVLALSKCFGVHAMYNALKVPIKSIDDIKAPVKEIIKGKLTESFAIRARSFSKSFSSKSIEMILGGVVLEDFPQLKVNLTSPKSELFVLIYDDFAYYYFEEIKGPQGMPVGSQGKVGLIINSSRGDDLAYSLLKLGSALTVCGKLSKRIEEFSLTFPIKYVTKSELVTSIDNHKLDAVFCDATFISEVKSLSQDLNVKVFAPFLF